MQLLASEGEVRVRCRWPLAAPNLTHKCSAAATHTGPAAHTLRKLTVPDLRTLRALEAAVALCVCCVWRTSSAAAAAAGVTATLAEEEKRRGARRSRKFAGKSSNCEFGAWQMFG